MDAPIFSSCVFSSSTTLLPPAGENAGICTRRLTVASPAKDRFGHVLADVERGIAAEGWRSDRQIAHHAADLEFSFPIVDQQRERALRGQTEDCRPQ